MIVIVGGGKTGKYLTKILVEEGEDVLVIEKNEDKAKEIANELGVVVIRGDATKPEILEKANIKNAKCIVCLTDKDEVNLITAMLAKQMGVEKTVVKLSNVYYDEEVLVKLGIDRIIYPEAATAEYISELVTKPDVLDLAFISRGDAEILEIEVTKKSKLLNKQIKDIEHPPGTAIIAVIKEDSLIIPDPVTRIKEGDKILILAKTEKIKEIKKLLG